MIDEYLKLFGLFIGDSFEDVKRGVHDHFKTVEILRLLNLGKENRLLYEVTEGLLKNPITIRKPDGGLYQSNIIADADYSQDRKTVTFTIADTMKSYLLKLAEQGEYTRFYLSNILGLTSKYSIAMYRFLKSFEFQRCVTKSVEELKFCLGIESRSFDNFGELKRRVLDISRIELEEKTNIRFDYTTESIRKKVMKITFTINWNPDNETRITQLNQVIALKEKDLEANKKEREKVHALAAESLRQAGINVKADNIKDNGDLDF